MYGDLELNKTLHTDRERSFDAPDFGVQSYTGRHEAGLRANGGIGPVATLPAVVECWVKW